MECQAVPYRGNEPYIFFSYCHRDSETVYPIIERMSRDGYRIWYDSGIHPGADWADEVANRLDGSTVIVSAISAAYSASINCRNELTLALSCQKSLLGIILEEFEMPLGMRLQTGTIQHVKYQGPEDVFFARLYEGEVLRPCREEGRASGRREEPGDFKTACHSEAGPALAETSTAVVGKEPCAVLIDLSGEAGYRLYPPLVRLGRSPARCDVVLSGHPEIGNYHADLIFQEGRCYLQDANSRNGSFFGRRLGRGERVPLNNPAFFRLARDRFQIVFGAPAEFLLRRESLLLLQNASTGERQCVTGPEFLLGRSCPWEEGTLADPKAGRRHAKLAWEESGLFIQDLDSTNGTYVNGCKLEKGGRRALNGGDIIRLGDTCLKCKLVAL